VLRAGVLVTSEPAPAVYALQPLGSGFGGGSVRREYQDTGTYNTHDKKKNVNN